MRIRAICGEIAHDLLGLLGLRLRTSVDAGIPCIGGRKRVIQLRTPACGRAVVLITRVSAFRRVIRTGAQFCLRGFPSGRGSLGRILISEATDGGWNWLPRPFEAAIVVQSGFFSSGVAGMLTFRILPNSRFFLDNPLFAIRIMPVLFFAKICAVIAQERCLTGPILHAVQAIPAIIFAVSATQKLS